MPDHGAPENLNEPVAVRRACFVLAYDGAAFHGFAPNPGVPTVVGVLSDAMELVSRHEINLIGAGRTDAGVHAWGQVVSCELPARVDLANLIHHVNRMCAPHVVVRSAEWMADDFSARFSATWRHYRYTIVNGPAQNPFLAATAWHVPQPLLLAGMQLACDALIGEHDFTTFCRKPKPAGGQPEPSLRRRVMLARWSDITDSLGPYAEGSRVLRFEIRANAFCHQMVRSIVGTHADVGRGRFHAGDMRALILARDRTIAGDVAPAHGLMLWQVGYDGERYHGGRGRSAPSVTADVVAETEPGGHQHHDADGASQQP
ncbi:unannotated protein [freshwater metagenome]|uniref:Unannotated protein n=1 Tax=freshwater metagenome TaxID=449393 RepID=A0A6J7FQV0_9ZZZZ